MRLSSFYWVLGIIAILVIIVIRQNNTIQKLKMIKTRRISLKSLDSCSLKGLYTKGYKSRYFETDIGFF